MRLAATLFLALFVSCDLPAPTRESVPWYWNGAEYVWVAGGKEVGSLDVRVELIPRDGEERFVIHEESRRSFIDVTAETRTTITCRSRDSSDYTAFHLIPQSIMVRSVFSNKVFESRVSEVTFEGGKAIAVAGDQTVETPVPEGAWIEPTIRVLVTTMPRRAGALIGMSLAYFDWKTREVRPHQWLFFYGWEWTDVRGERVHLARFDRMEGFDRQASYWVDRANRLVKVSALRTADLILKR